MTILQKQILRDFRYPLVLSGRYMLIDRTEWSCHTVNVSTSGVLIKALARPVHGERIVAYLEDVGRLEGRVVRLDPTGFALRLITTDVKRQRLNAMLDALAAGKPVQPRIDPDMLRAPERNYASELLTASPTEGDRPAPAKRLPSSAAFQAYLGWRDAY